MVRSPLLTTAAVVLLLGGCAGGGADRLAAQSGWPASASVPKTATAVALPNSPPASAGCDGNVIDHQDISHPSLGTVRVFLLLKTSIETNGHGCVASVTRTGIALPAIPIDVYENSLAFARPATDATGNTFITYNPGRYDGVLALVPTEDGFEDIGWSDASYGTHYDGKRAYYNARLDAIAADGQYRIRTYHDDCTPSCAEGATSEVVLHWDGTDYVA